MTKYDITALAIDDLVQLLKNCGSSAATRESLEADISAGCPVNSDGTISLPAYAAWLVRQAR